MKHPHASPKASRKSPKSPEALHHFQNLYLYPIELQRFLKKTLKKSSFSSRKSLISLIHSKSFNINSKNSSSNFQKSIQKVQLLTSLQEKQVEEIIKKDSSMIMTPINRVFLKSVSHKASRGNLRRQSTNLFRKGNTEEMKRTQAMMRKNEETKLYNENVNTFQENMRCLEEEFGEVKQKSMSEMEKIDVVEMEGIAEGFLEEMEKLEAGQEKAEEFSLKNETLMSLNFEYPEEFELDKKPSLSRGSVSEFNDFSTKDECFFELENLDFSQSFNQSQIGKSLKESEFVGRINKILGGKQVKDLTDMVIAGQDSLMQNLLDEEEKDVYLWGLIFYQCWGFLFYLVLFQAFAFITNMDKLSEPIT